MGIIRADAGKTVKIAYQGENKRQQVAFPLADIMEEFPGGTAVLAILRKGDTDPVPAAITEMDGTDLIWTVTAWECAKDDFIYAQITYTVDEVVAKTKTYRFDVKGSLIVSAAEPETWQDMVGQLVTAAAALQAAIDAYDAMTAEAEGLAAGSAPTAEIDHTGDTPVLKLGIPAGANGYSPSASVSKVGKKATITITDQQGTTTAEISDGTDGADVIDDTAGSGDTGKTWSADKIVGELGEKYEKPAGGIPATDLASAAQTSLGKADTAYQKPSGGIPATDLASAAQTSLGKADTAYQKPAGGIPATDLASGVIPDPTSIIDDTAGAGDTDKTFSADKLATDHSSLLNAINGKQDAPSSTGTAGQVLSLDSNLDPVWVNQNEASNSPIEYKFSGSDILLGFGYNDTNDAVIVMNRGRANNLFDFAKLCTKAKGTSLQNLNTSDLTSVWSSGTDMHGPFQFLATSNADGYHHDAVSAGFVGGNHTLDQLGTGFETATSVYVEYYADGVPVSTGYGKATHFEIRWANDIQAYNTVKQGGGGRACLREYHDMIFDGVIFRERITLKPLEEIKLNLWYGLQCVSIGTTYTNIAFVDATNRGTFSSSDSDIKSGNAVTSGFVGYGNNHRIEMNVDTTIDLGKRQNYSGTSGAFVSGNKGYFFIIGTAVTMSADEKYYLDGSYRFMPNIAEGIPCTGIALDQDTLTFESAEETKTLTATLTPANTTDTIEWTSSNNNIATVNSSGVVTIHGIGSATITATCGTQTATASISQVTLKAQYGTKKVTGYNIGQNDTILKLSKSSGTNCIAQGYHEDNTDLHVRYGRMDDVDVEMIRVPYGATKACIATTNDTAVTISYGFIGDTTDLKTVTDKQYPAFVSRTTWVNTNTGLTVEYGQCVAFYATDTQFTTLDYVYFK